MIGELHIDTVFIFFIFIQGTRNILLLLQSKQTYFWLFYLLRDIINCNWTACNRYFLTVLWATRWSQRLEGLPSVTTTCSHWTHGLYHLLTPLITVHTCVKLVSTTVWDCRR